ncbi:COG4223 family protein [Sulfitobacter pacificus]|uniref:COG4223 family protein n=1 Tax=Sulfitobacter pacificus TaxID=1499314 RepID=UPI0024E0B926|nr:hypothetical protein [Sulfitobacter pacificus]
MAKAKKPTPSSKSTSGAPKDLGGTADSKAKTAAPSSQPAKTDGAKTTAAKTVAAKTGIPKTGTPKKAPAPKADKVTSDKVATTPAKAAEAVKTAAATTTSSVPKTPKPEASQKTGPSVDVKKPDEPAKAESKPAEPAKNVEKPQPVKEQTPAASPQQDVQEPKGSVFWSLVFGGLVAGGIGFFAAEMDVFNLRGENDSVTEALNAQAARIATLENAEVPDATPVELPELNAIKSSIAALSDGVTALEARLAELENRPASTVAPAGPSPELEEGLAALQASVEAQQNEISRLLENAQSVEEATADAARRAQAERALSTITVALGSGAGFETALQDLTASGVEDIPAALSENAEGIVPLLRLQTSFPDTARAALSVARTTGGGQNETGVGGFLKRQLSARSVAPREGDDPDAVLSRAEAAVRDGRVADALTEIETLPAPVQDAMADWLASARARAATEAAVQDLSQRLTAN